MKNRLLDATGSIQLVDDRLIDGAVLVPTDDSIDTLDVKAAIAAAELAIVEFLSVADGRGFSIAAELREDTGYCGQLLATGKLNPDQVTLAFQCGFDGVVIDAESWNRYGETAWSSALTPVVASSYQRYHWQSVGSIWDIRSAPVAGS